MHRLPLVEVPAEKIRDWLQPEDVQEAFRIQPRFVCPDLCGFSWTLVVILIPSTYFLLGILPNLLDEEQAFLRSWACVSSLLWALASLIALVCAACRNPGVVPRATNSTPGQTRYIVLNNVMLKQRYCSTCRLYRPTRSKHCSTCNRCVFRFDHHCSWLGNCVGLGNYRSFLFLITVAMTFYGEAAVITCRILNQALSVERAFAFTEEQPRDALRRTVSNNIVKVLFAIYAVLSCLALLVLVLYHLIIIGQNMTTNEHVRDYYPAKNPYDVSCTANYRQVFCAPYGRIIKINKNPYQESPSTATSISTTPSIVASRPASRAQGSSLDVAATEQDALV